MAKMEQKNFDYIKMMASILWDVLEEVNPKDDKSLKECIIKAKAKYVAERGLVACGGYAAEYISDAKRAITEWGYSYDEGLQEVNIKYGYNPITGKWDGTYEGCEVGRGRKRGA